MAYTILGELGRGAYGSVYKIERDGSLFALKERSYPSSLIAPHDFLREVAVTMNARHPNIVRAYQIIFDTEQRRVSTSFELGTLTLTQWMRQPRTFDEKLSVTFQLLCGLQFLHAAGLIHGDLKPDNILLFKDGSTKIADFGLCVRNGGQPLSFNVQTILWRAPEVLSGIAYTHSIDIWSLGVVLYQLFGGELLFTETDPAELLASQYSTCPLDLQMKGVNDVMSLVMGCLVLDPTKRLTASDALKCPIFKNWIQPVGYWVELEIQTPSDHKIIHDTLLGAAPGTIKLACELVERSSVHDSEEMVACCAIAAALLQNVTLDLSLGAKNKVKMICERLQYCFYSGLG